MDAAYIFHSEVLNLSRRPLLRHWLRGLLNSVCRIFKHDPTKKPTLAGLWSLRKSASDPIDKYFNWRLLVGVMDAFISALGVQVHKLKLELLLGHKQGRHCPALTNMSRAAARWRHFLRQPGRGWWCHFLRQLEG